MVLMVNNVWKASNEFRKQAMVLNYQTIFKVNNSCECSKLIFQILVYYYYKLFYTGI